MNEQMLQRMKRDHLGELVPILLGYVETNRQLYDADGDSDTPDYDYTGRCAELYSQFNQCCNQATEQLGSTALEGLLTHMEMHLPGLITPQPLTEEDENIRFVSLMNMCDVDNSPDNRTMWTRSTHFQALCESLLRIDDFVLETDQEESPVDEGVELVDEPKPLEIHGMPSYHVVEQWLIEEILDSQSELLDSNGGEVPSYAQAPLLMRNRMSRPQRAKSAIAMHLILIFFKHHRRDGNVDRHAADEDKTPEDVFLENLPWLRKILRHLTQIELVDQPFERIQQVWAELTRIFIHLFMINHDTFSMIIDGIVVRGKTTWLMATLLLGEMTNNYPEHCVIAINTDSKPKQTIDEEDFTLPTRCDLWSCAIYSNLSMQLGMSKFVHVVPEDIGNRMFLRFENSYDNDEEE